MNKPRLTLDDPASFLAWLAGVRKRGSVSLDEVDVAQVFAIAGVAALARLEGKERLLVEEATQNAARFAHAIGFEEVVGGEQPSAPGEADRTVKLTRVKGRGPWEPTAEKIVSLLFPSSTGDASRHLFKHVLVELLRNVGQHSNDPLGGIVTAQRNDAGPYVHSPVVQVVVVDNGIGVFEALRHMRPSIKTPAEALVRALEPHVSGAFEEGQSGSGENAGLGLFFVSEFAKETDGRLFLASRGATYFLDRSQSSETQPVLTNGVAPDYPGTLVAFETAIAHVGSFDGIMAHIRDLAMARMPKRITQNWLRFEAPPPEALHILVAVASEDTAAAQAYSMNVLQPRLLERRSIALDFRNMRVCTQSFLHALLHQAVRLAWALKVPMFVVNAAPAVRAQLELVEAYSLGG
ncbi:MAG: sensor histidine kinase [Planctomycetes bacterium]|nr:sensor histidine kinase [Planctomycetota bacterium]